MPHTLIYKNIVNKKSSKTSHLDACKKYYYVILVKLILTLEWSFLLVKKWTIGLIIWIDEQHTIWLA
jgi:hypothetical protein